MQRRDFDQMVPTHHVRMGVAPATCDQLPVIFDLAQREIPVLLAPLQHVERVWSHNRDGVLVFVREEEVVGVYAMLLLNATGVQRLMNGDLDTYSPDLDCISPPAQTPAAIYNWAVVAPGLAAEGLRYVSEYLRQPEYRKANLYARGTTPAACRLMEHLGYKLLGGAHPDLYRYERVANRQPDLPVAA
ncbi:MAG: hypothetical protein ACR2PM_20565 [Hyphomicrobiales bacterium]